MSDQVTTYVAGFLFHRESVLLVCKRKPDWQRGLWDAIGGKVEDGETPEKAMHREFLEETTLDATNWRCFCTEVGRDYTVHFFRDVLDGSERAPVVPEENDREEELRWHSCGKYDVPFNYVGNLHWLIPMALDWRGVISVVSATRNDIKERPTW